MTERQVDRLESIGKMSSMYLAMKEANENYDKDLRSRSGLSGGDGEKMMEEVFSSKEIYLESVYKKHLQTKLFLNFLESTFKEYIKETEISMKPKSELKIAILSEVYMEGKEIKQFLYEHNLGYGRTFYYARNELYEELAVRVFGIYALKL